EESLDAVPVARALPYDVALALCQLVPRHVPAQLVAPGDGFQIVVSALVRGRVERRDRPLAECLAGIRNHAGRVDARHAPEALTRLARTPRRVEREESGNGIRESPSADVANETPEKTAGGRKTLSALQGEKLSVTRVECQ